MEPKKFRDLLRVLGALILLLASYLAYRYEAERHEIPETIPGNFPEVPATSPDGSSADVAHVPSNVQVLDRLRVDKGVKTKLYLDSIGFDKARYNHILAQKALVRQFKDTVKLDIVLPGAMDFDVLDLEDDIAGIHGQTFNGEREFAMLATARKVELKDALEYLRTSQDALPMLKSHQFQEDKMVTIQAPASTGLGTLQVVPSTTVDGKTVYAAFATRKDGSGSYMFMMEAPPQYFDQNEDGLEKMLQTVKTRP